MHLNKVSLEDRIENVRKKMDNVVEVSAVTSIVGEVMGTFEGDFDLQESHFQDELRDLLNHIEQTKADLVEIRPKHLSENKIPEASDQLDHVLLATEEAASRIMDSAEELSELAATMDGETGEKLMAISTHIFEASSFQDITGQRVTKVVNTLKYLEEKLAMLARTIGDTDSASDGGDDAASAGMKQDLLAGPQCQVTGNDQDAIDALFDSFD